MSTSAEPVISVSIGEVSSDVLLIDSGSPCNVISVHTVHELKHQGLKIELRPGKKSCSLMGGRELEVKGRFQSEVSVAKTKIVVDFIVWQNRTLFVMWIPQEVSVQRTVTLLMKRIFNAANRHAFLARNKLTFMRNENCSRSQALLKIESGQFVA